MTTIAEHHFNKGKAAGHEQGMNQCLARGMIQGMDSENALGSSRGAFGAA
jgi:hypothetical protein